jgi:hypothetical protein
MMRSIFVTLIITIFTSTLFGQVSINTNGLPPDNSAMLDVSSLNRGFLFPRLSTSGRNSIPSPAKGLLIYNTSSKLFDYFNGSIWCQIGAFPVSSVTGTIRSGGGVSLRSVPGAIPDSSSMLDVNDATRGVLLPRTTPNLITSPANGLIIYNSSTNHFNYYDGSNWRELCSISTGAAGAGGSQSRAGIAVNANNALPDPSSILDISATNKGLLIPRLTKNQRDAIKPVSGLTIFNLTSGSIEFYNGSGWYQMKVNLLTPPTPAAHVPELTQITWKWNKIPGQPYYKWNTTNNYATAIDLGSDTSKTETGLTCNTSYTRYVWAYNDCGATTSSSLVKTTLACSTPPNEYCAEANALFARMTVQPTVLRKSAIDHLIRGMIKDTIWSKLDWFQCYSVETQQQALLDWKRQTISATNVNMAFHADSGFMGNGTSAYINTAYDPGINNVNYALLNGCFGLYTWRNLESTSCGINGVIDSSNSVYIIPGSTSNELLKASLNGTSGGSTGINESKTNGFFYVERTQSNTITNQYNSTREEYSNTLNASTIPTGRNIFIGAYNVNGTASYFDRNTFALGFGGAALSASQSNSLLDHFNHYLTDIGLRKPAFGVIGDSHVCALNGYPCQSVANSMNDSVPNSIYNFTDLSADGENIAEQKAKWLALSPSVRRNLDYVFINIGLNNVVYYFSAPDIIAGLQDLVTTISNDIGENHSIVLNSFNPFYGWALCHATGGACTYRHTLAAAQSMLSVWYTVRTAIMDGTSITRAKGSIYKINAITNELGTGDGYYKPMYDAGDMLHPNCAGRLFIADTWEQVYLINK